MEISLLQGHVQGEPGCLSAFWRICWLEFDSHLSLPLPHPLSLSLCYIPVILEDIFRAGADSVFGRQLQDRQIKTVSRRELLTTAVLRRVHGQRMSYICATLLQGVTRNQYDVYATGSVPM